MDFVIQKQQWTLGRLTVVANWFILYWVLYCKIHNHHNESEIDISNAFSLSLLDAS